MKNNYHHYFWEKIIKNLKEGKGTLEISYNGLKTAEGNDQYTYSLKLNKLITTITSIVDKGSFDKYYEDEKYELLTTLGEGEGPAKSIEWEIYKERNGAYRKATDATITLNAETQKYEFKTNQNATGKYKILAIIPADGKQPRVQETLEEKEPITVEQNDIINKMTITKKDNTTVVVTPEETTGSLDIYNGYPQSLAVKFEHVYSNGRTRTINVFAFFYLV